MYSSIYPNTWKVLQVASNFNRSISNLSKVQCIVLWNLVCFLQFIISVNTISIAKHTHEADSYWRILQSVSNSRDSLPLWDLKDLPYHIHGSPQFASIFNQTNTLRFFIPYFYTVYLLLSPINVFILQVISSLQATLISFLQ
jgi:hypothetical protein